MKNLVRHRRLFQNLFDDRRDFLAVIESWLGMDTKTYHCGVSVPGIDPGILELRVGEETVTFRGERKAKRSEKDVDFHCEEINYRSCERAFSLPEGVDTGRWLLNTGTASWS